MGTQALVGALCWLMLRSVFGESQEDNMNVNAIVVDSQSEESAPLLYRVIPDAVYASAAPHAAFSFHAPAFVSPPVSNNAGLRHLKDSYGQYVQAPHFAAYKTSLPQQYIQLQELPAHLAQPLLAHSNVRFRTVPHFSSGQSYRINHQKMNHNHGGHSQPLVYAEKLRNFTPQQARYEVYRVHSQHNTPQTHSHYQIQQPSHHVRYANSPTYQKIPDVTHQSFREPKQQSSSEQTPEQNNRIQAAPAQTSITAIVNGKKTVITLDTKPPLPLLDLNLLEPLTFKNPLVPQIQNYLPRINSATYHKLPEFNEAKRKDKKVAHKTQSSDDDDIVAKPKKQSPKKKYKPPVHHAQADDRPAIIPAALDGVPEISYEINKPGHKEVYNEQVISYNKETTSKPITYTYHKTSQKEPVTYSFKHSSKEPLHVKHLEYDSNKDTNPPKELIHKIPLGEHKGHSDSDNRPPKESESSEESNESGEDNDEQGNTDQKDDDEEENNNEDLTRQTHHSNQHVQHHNHKGSPGSNHHHNHRDHHNESPYYNPHHNSHSSHESSRHSSPQSVNNHRTYGSEAPQSHSSHRENHQRESPKTTHHHSFHDDNHETLPENVHYDSPAPNRGLDSIPSHLLPPEHRNEEPHFRPNVNRQPVFDFSPQHYSRVVSADGPRDQFHQVFQEFPQVIHIGPPTEEYAAIKVNPAQHIQQGAPPPHATLAPKSAAPQKHVKQQHQEQDDSLDNGPAPQIYQKSKHVLIKENEETPNEMHSLAEQLMHRMVQQEENSEEDFEKAYKESAFGFPAYEETDDLEKDIYNPESYGVPRQHVEYDIEHHPFEQYTKGDEFPTSVRAEYKDARDNMQKNYFLDYSISKPESFTDRYKSKENYYKNYEKHRPESFFGPEKEKEAKKEKIVLASSFLFPKSTKAKKSQHFAEYRIPKGHNYGFPKVERDSTPYSSQPYHKHKTFFVEPQFQYGFVPIAAPLTLDSELAAMASNESPETQTGKPGIRKKVYKENWYIKKTSTTAAKPS